MSTKPSAGSTSVGSHPAPGGEPQQQQHMLAPIRWPKPDKTTIVLLAIWALGLVVAIVVPALIVPPRFDQTSVITDGTAEPHTPASVSGVEVAIAMGFTVLGALAMVVSAYAIHRRTGSIGAAVLAFVPTFVVVASGAIIATMLLLA